MNPPNLRVLRSVNLLFFLIGYIPVSMSDVDPRNIESTAESNLPNFLIVVADDLGFSDLGFTGSEIRTPNIDQLAARGSVLTNFYTAPTCSPTRSMLLSGVDHHRAGLGSMHEIMSDDLRQHPGYEGYLNDRVAHLPALLKERDYFNFVAGKWHLGLTAEQSPKARGFDRSFVMLNGGASHFADRAGLFEVAPWSSYRADGELIKHLPKNFYSSSYYAERSMAWIDEAIEQRRPFFGYLAFTAPHWPLQVPDDYLDRYQGAYDDGYETLRKHRLAAMQASGFIPDEVELAPRLSFVPAWDALSPSEQQLQRRQMELYAAMVEKMDAELGRVLDHLESKGVGDNTVILFFSDNGPEGTDALTILGNEKWVPKRFDNSLANLGKVDSYTSIGPGWAQASATPGNLFKSFPAEGGIKSPAVLWSPSSPEQPKRIEQILSVADIFPTLLELAGIANPYSKDDTIMTGTSFADALRSANWSSVNERVFAWELFGRAAVRAGDWKALKLHPPQGSGDWQLFNLRTDPSEQIDRSAENPGVLQQLIAAWNDYVRGNGVVVMNADLGYGSR